MVRVHLGAGHMETADPDLVAAQLWAEGATAVEIREVDDGVVLLAGYPTAEGVREVALRLGPSLGAAVEEVSDQGWRDAWKAWAEPVPIGDRLLVVPAGRRGPVASDRLHLDIDPGECFGSGTHPSTRMILTWLEAHPPEDRDVIDIGSGSGILSVAAARLGARSVTAIDIDPAAVAATRDNAVRNGVADRISSSPTPVEMLPPDSADVVLVNVTAGVHAVIGAACSATLRPSGKLVLAGLLPGQWQHIEPAYSGMTATDALAVDGWEGMALVRSPA